MADGIETIERIIHHSGVLSPPPLSHTLVFSFEDMSRHCMRPGETEGWGRGGGDGALMGPPTHTSLSIIGREAKKKKKKKK